MLFATWQPFYLSPNVLRVWLWWRQLLIRSGVHLTNALFTHNWNLIKKINQVPSYPVAWNFCTCTAVVPPAKFRCAHLRNFDGSKMNCFKNRGEKHGVRWVQGFSLEGSIGEGGETGGGLGSPVIMVERNLYDYLLLYHMYGIYSKLNTHKNCNWGS